jgi:simple sugar transport system ATP-binding protein
LTKRFPGVLANDSISLDVFPGEVHALLGENGAGKSTLVKCIYGYYQRDAGEILIDGLPANLRTPAEARRRHVGMVFQNLTLIPALTVVENVALFLPDLPVVPNLPAIAGELEALGERYQLRVDPWAHVQDLSIGQQQKAELLKLLLGQARILILDEPTRVLAPHEVEGLFRVLAHLAADGLAVIFITHKLNEVLHGADRITVLRQGRVAGRLSRAEATEDKLVRLMFERDFSSLSIDRPATGVPIDPPILELRGAATEARGATIALQPIDLKIHPGEIVGVAGVSGNGQRELGDLILGDLACAQGSKWLYGKEVTRAAIGEMRREGVSFIPEDPLAMAAVPMLSVLENIAVTRTDHYAREGGLRMDWPAVRLDAEDAMQRLGFSFSLAGPARSLSGGNLQRMVIVRELSHDPRLIIASYITRGLDAQSARAAQRALLQARARGAGVLFISEDLEELFLLSDRLVVLYAGQIVGRFRPEETEPVAVGRLMTGSESEHVRSD